MQRQPAAATLLLVLLLLPAAAGAAAPVSDGAAITPVFARALYERLANLKEADGCRLSRFDTSRFRISIGVRVPGGVERTMDVAAAASGDAGLRVGGWTVGVSDGLQRDCGATLAAMERVLAETKAPSAGIAGAVMRVILAEVRFNLVVLGASFVLLLIGTLQVLYREVKRRRPSPWAVLALFAIWAAALGLRLGLSPRTFLHEYYHIAETLSAYLTHDRPLLYGDTGPALFGLVAHVLGRRAGVEVIFLTNAVLASLAVPAVALLDLGVMGRWSRALCAALLLCVLPEHLRFSAAEDLFVQALTFGLWALALFVLYLRERRLDDVLLCALALSLAMQARPEMLFFPAALVALVLLAEPRSWRVLFAWRTLLALLVLAVLLIPRAVELQKTLHDVQSASPVLPAAARYLGELVFFQAQVTPPVYWVLCLLGLAWGVRHKLGYHLWALLLFGGYTLFSLSLFDNPTYNVRSQLLPTSFLVLIAAGAAPLWMAAWGRRRSWAWATGAGLLAAVAVLVVLRGKSLITELRDQQLEWAFLERTVPLLPEQGTLLSATENGPRELDAFPQFLLQRAGKEYDLFDVRRVAAGEAPWPVPGDDLLYYQGMFCYFTFGDQPPPASLTPPCEAVHEHYLAQPLFTAELDTEGYSWLQYAPGPFRIGFFRLQAR